MLLIPLVGCGAIAYRVWLPPVMFGFQPSSVGVAPASPTRSALLRVLNGVLIGQWKARRVGIAMQLVVIVGLLLAW